MNDDHFTDKLLDETAVRIRNSPVPDYPGPSLLDPLASAMSKPIRESSTPRQLPRAAVIAVSCSLVALLAVMVGVMTRNAGDDDRYPQHHIAMDDSVVPVGTTNLTEPSDLRIGRVQVSSINITPEFDRMTDQLDRLAARLHLLETEVSLREVKSDAAILLAEYAPRKSTVW